MIVLLGLSGPLYSQEKKLELHSPDGSIKLSLHIGDKIYYTLYSNEVALLSDNQLLLHLSGETPGAAPHLLSASTSKGDDSLHPYISWKYAAVRNQYNSLLLKFKGNYAVELRAFNDGVAYRFITSKKDSILVSQEEAGIHFPATYTLHLQQPHSFETSYEEPYTHLESDSWKADGRMATLPVLIDTKSKYKILISESDLSDYPCLFFKSSGNNGMEATFPKVPLTFNERGDRSITVTKEADYIAKTRGSRTFPWRYFVVTKDDKELLENTMTLKLAAKSKLKDPSWVKPGQASWEWWNGASPYGPDVNFVSGCNLATYKYYIDFASKYGISYIVMDEGWAKTTTDPFTPNPDVDLHELVRYGQEKHVGIVLWLTWLSVYNHMDLFKTFKDWGIKGVKIDFMDRSDQWMVNFYERVAKTAAENQLFVDFHGAFKPAGLEYKYPNVLSYEGVRGMEQMGGCKPDNSIYLPFIRNAVGPMDYTPGAMLSMQPDVYISERPNAATIGTRVYQLALFVVFESGLQMLADNPTLYYRNEDCTEFITQVPTTWDETKALVATAGEVAVVAKRKQDKWFIGGMTNGKQAQREVTIGFDFLSPGKTYTMTYFEDGINAGTQAMDYRKKIMQVKKGDTLTLHMARNGGWAAVLQ
ncbi:alpha-glucosidase [Chitinophaga costaii]|nr:alpha-glucosidase [Chitinophaga costaii]